jgi:hypothetical protein
MCACGRRCGRRYTWCFRRDRKGATPPDEEIRIDFPAVQQSAAGYRARPDQAGWRPRGGSAPDDIAVLEFMGPDPMPAECQPVLGCRKIDEDNEIVAYGVKPGLPEGTYVRGKIVGYLSPVRVEVFAEHEDQAIRKGCSGGAAWNMSRGGIAGMIVEMETNKQGRIIPVEKLR